MLLSGGTIKQTGRLDNVLAFIQQQKEKRKEKKLDSVLVFIQQQ